MSEEHMDRQLYMEPRVLATYSKEELDETIKPHGTTDTYGCEEGCGCGCGCACPPG